MSFNQTNEYKKANSAFVWILCGNAYVEAIALLGGFQKTKGFLDLNVLFEHFLRSHFHKI